MRRWKKIFGGIVASAGLIHALGCIVGNDLSYLAVSGVIIGVGAFFFKMGSPEPNKYTPSLTQNHPPSTPPSNQIEIFGVNGIAVIKTVVQLVIDKVKADKGGDAYMSKPISAYREAHTQIPSVNYIPGSGFNLSEQSNKPTEQTPSIETISEDDETGILSEVRKHSRKSPEQFGLQLGVFECGGKVFDVWFGSQSFRNMIVIVAYERTRNTKSNEHVLFEFYHHDVEPLSSSSVGFSIKQLFENTQLIESIAAQRRADLGMSYDRNCVRMSDNCTSLAVKELTCLQENFHRALYALANEKLMAKPSRSQ